MRSALVGCCAAALALVAPGGVGAQPTHTFGPITAEERLCRDTDILVCGNTGAESTLSDWTTGTEYPGGTYATVRAGSNIAVQCPATINSPLETWQGPPPPLGGGHLAGHSPRRPGHRRRLQALCGQRPCRRRRRQRAQLPDRGRGRRDGINGVLRLQGVRRQRVHER